jgi:hypothetical protein
MMVIEWRHGFGLDIEANDVVCYVVHDEDEKETMVQFSGIIINLPLIKVHIGEFYEVE